MLKKITLIVFLAFSFVIAKSQPCPSTSFTFATQEDIDLFQSLYPFCSVIPDNVDVTIMGNNITSLGPLAQINVFLGSLEIRDCPMLTSLNGLHNVTTIGNDAQDRFVLRNLQVHDTLKFLSQLTFITGDFTIQNCDSLVFLGGLSNLTRVDGALIIRENDALENLNGLNGLNCIDEELEIEENSLLTSVAALNNVDTIGSIEIEDNAMLSNLLGLGHDSTVIKGNLNLLDNIDLIMCAVPSICNYLANPPAGAMVSIAGNVTGCNSPAEVITDCAFVTVNNMEQDSYGSMIVPNPIINRFQVISSFQWCTAEIFDASGRYIETLYAVNGPYFDFGYTSGVYYFKMTGNNAQSEVIKVVK